jgi:carboxyl-terminal processing protease
MPGTPSIQLGLRGLPRDGRLVLTSVDLDSKAFWAGFRQGDEILKLNNIDVSRLSWLQIAELIASGPVIWVVNRSGEILTIVTDNSSRENAKFESSVVLWRDQAYARMALRTFEGDTALCTRMSKRLEEIHSRWALSGIVLDLRGNGGGSVDFARCVNTIFLGPGKSVATMRALDRSYSEEWKTLTENEMRKQGLVADTKTPMVVLVDGASASASELTAGALRDHHRAWNVGLLTFGKGSVNMPHDWPWMADKVLEYATGALFFQPNETSNELVGIIPDFEVAPRFAGKDLPDRVRRSAELYPDLPFKVNEASPPPRSEEIARIKACVDKSAIETKEAAMHASRVSPDHQLLHALEVLRCSRLADF